MERPTIQTAEGLRRIAEDAGLENLAAKILQTGNPRRIADFIGMIRATNDVSIDEEAVIQSAQSTLQFDGKSEELP